MSTRLPKIFLDSGNPEETKKAKGALGFIDGQTTNPTLVARHPEAQKFLSQGRKLTEQELLNFYHQVVKEIEKEVAGPISVEVYADWQTKASEMLRQAEKMFSWGKNIYIKFPVIPEGLKAAHEFVKSGGRANMTLVFDQSQAAAVYAATLGNKFPAFVSPFVGRWDDRGFCGLDLIKNILKMYKKFDKQKKQKKHVLVLSASIRNLNHFYSSIFFGADIITAPLKIIEEWVEEARWVPDNAYQIERNGLKPLLYQNIPLRSDFTNYPVEKNSGSLLDEGLKKFVSDWKSLL